MHALSPMLSVIVSSYNDRSALQHMLRSLSAQTYRNFEAVVADDGSSDGSQAAAAAFATSDACSFPMRVVCQRDEGWRLAAVRNLGASVARGEYLVFVDGDQYCDRELLSTYANQMGEADAGAGVRHYVSNRRNERSETCLVTPRVVRRDRRIAEDKVHSGAISWFQVWGCNCMVKREVWDSLGGFDEDYRGWGCEETDFFCRVDRAGHRIHGFPEAVVYHFPEIHRSGVHSGVRLWREVKRFDNTVERNGGRHRKRVNARADGVLECIE